MWFCMCVLLALITPPCTAKRLLFRHLPNHPPARLLAPRSTSVSVSTATAGGVSFSSGGSVWGGVTLTLTGSGFVPTSASQVGTRQNGMMCVGC